MLFLNISQLYGYFTPNFAFINASGFKKTSTVQLFTGLNYCVFREFICPVKVLFDIIIGLITHKKVENAYKKDLFNKENPK